MARDNNGFTLLEVLIVMIIISIMVGASTIMFKRDHQDLLQVEADRLRALISLARDEAVFQARSLGIYFSRNSYVFMQQTDADQGRVWSAVPDKQFRKRTLDTGVRLTLFRGETELNLQAEEVLRPQVFLLTTGEVTPFTVELRVPAKASLEFSVDGLGQSKVLVNEVF